MGNRQRDERRRGLEVESRGRRRLYTGFGLFLAAFGLAGVLYSGLRSPTFEDARADRTKRGAYVEAVERSLGEIEAVEDIKYVRGKALPKNRYVKGEIAIETDFIAGTIGQGKRVIRVYDASFESSVILHEEDFLSGLVDHEIEGHAKPFHSGFKDMDIEESDLLLKNGKYHGELYCAVLELYAVKKQMERTQNRQINPELAEDIYTYYWRYYSDLFHPSAEGWLKDESNLEKFRKMFFIHRFLVDHVKTENYSGPVMMPDGRMMTTHGPVEVPDYLKEKIRTVK